MTVSFDDKWERLLKELYKGQVIKNWGKGHGFTGNTFKIIDITEDVVICQPPKAINLQVVPKDNFRKVWEIWPKYLSGDYPRYQIRDEITRFSSYIISIFHLLD